MHQHFIVSTASAKPNIEYVTNFMDKVVEVKNTYFETKIQYGI